MEIENIGVGSEGGAGGGSCPHKKFQRGALPPLTFAKYRRNSSQLLVISSFYKRHGLPNAQIKGQGFVDCCVKLLHCRARVLPALRKSAFTDKRMRNAPTL